MSDVRQCASCGKTLPQTKRVDALYCDRVCQMREARKRYECRDPEAAKRRALARRRKWAAANPAKRSAYEGARRARLAGAPHASPGSPEWEAIVAVYEEALRLSRNTGVKHEVDHDTPLSKGGGHFAANLTVLPQEAHWRKTANERSLN